MSLSHEGTEIRGLQSGGTLESKPSEKNNHCVTIEEIGNQKIDKKVVQTELDAKTSGVCGEAEIEQNNSVEQSRDISIGDIASKPKTDVEKRCRLEAQPPLSCFVQENKSMKSNEHKEKEPYHVVFVPETSSSTDGMSSRTKYIVIPQEDSPEASKKRELILCVKRTALDTGSKDKSEEYNQLRDFTSSGYRFLSRPVPKYPCTELDVTVKAPVTSPVVERETIQFCGGFDMNLPYNENSSESEDGTVSESEQDSLEDTQTSPRGDEESVRMKLVDNTSNFLSWEQESFLFGRNENVKVVRVSAVGFTAKRVEPCIIVLSDKFRISFDISPFSKESISCRVVGNKLDVYAMESRPNDYGHEMHEIHQIFKIPLHVDKDKFKASVKNGVLFMEAPLEIGR